ncbi:hypothetical protein [Cupriavidus sp. USMAA2-4]|uniref:hypothetical protein n=1 Tax=Cupriavidus sp. USMAA2-4 TaxID=876364 RepID=UPI0012F52AD5|nr:hypothetical protein [Cupriavidus sp. USMAA2-4]
MLGSPCHARRPMEGRAACCAGRSRVASAIDGKVRAIRWFDRFGRDARHVPIDSVIVVDDLVESIIVNPSLIETIKIGRGDRSSCRNVREMRVKVAW